MRESHRESHGNECVIDTFASVIANREDDVMAKVESVQSSASTCVESYALGVSDPMHMEPCEDGSLSASSRDRDHAENLAVTLQMLCVHIFFSRSLPAIAVPALNPTGNLSQRRRNFVQVYHVEDVFVAVCINKVHNKTINGGEIFLSLAYRTV